MLLSKLFRGQISVREHSRRVNKKYKSYYKEEFLMYHLRFPQRRFESLFGTAYPRLGELEPFIKASWIREGFLSNANGRNKFFVHIAHKAKGPFLYYDISVEEDGPISYDYALAMEEKINNLTKLKFISPPRFWYKYIPTNYPEIVYNLDNLHRKEVIDWLLANCEPSDYQMFKRSDELDTSLGFRNPDHGLMFKLAFGDQL